MNNPKIVLKVQGVVSDTSLETDCCVKMQEHELKFILNRNLNSTSLSLLIGGNQCYIIDLQVAKKILELISSDYYQYCPECFGRGTIVCMVDGVSERFVCDKCLGNKVLKLEK